MYALKTMSFWAIAALVLGGSLISAKETRDCGLSKPFEITARSQLFDLANGDNSLGASTSCPDEIITAIKELSLIVDDNENVCSQEKANRIRDFHAIYLAADKKRTIKLPKPVKQFFVGYALKVSQLCRRLAIENLVAASNSLLQPEDFDAVNKLTNEKSVFAKLIGEPKDYDNLVLPKNLIRLLRSRGERVNQEKLFIQMGTIKTIARLRHSCANKFKPIYEKLLIPLVTISSYGYNFNDAASDVAENTSEPDQVGKQVFQWYRITLLCEVIDSIELISASNTDKKTNVVKILSKKEAEELRNTSPNLFFDEQSQEEQSAESPIVYEPNYATAAQLDNLVIDQSDKRLIKKIKDFKNGNVVSRFLRKVAKSAKEQFASGLVNLAISKNAVILNDGKEVSDSRDLVKIIDDQIYREESGSESAVALEGEWKSGLVGSVVVIVFVFGLIGLLLCFAT